MKKIIIFGNSNFAKLMKWYIENDTDREVECFCVEERFITQSYFEKLKVVPFEHIEEKYTPDKYEILIAIGQSGMNNIREKIFNKCKSKGYHVASYIHSSCIQSNSKIGEGNIILEKTLIQPYAEIGNGNLIWYGVLIAHDDVIGNFNTIAGGVSLCGFVHIKNNCYIGNASMIHEYTIIDDYTLVGAGAYVKESTSKYDVVVPARSVILEGRKSIEFM